MRKSICLVAIVFTSACTASPTAVPDHRLEPAHPLSNGLFGGSGNYAEADSTSSNQAQTAAVTSEVTAADSVPNRGGLFGGSGN